MGIREELSYFISDEIFLGKHTLEKLQQILDVSFRSRCSTFTI